MPAKLDTTRRAPLVFVLHGSGGEARALVELWRGLADYARRKTPFLFVVGTKDEPALPVARATHAETLPQALPSRRTRKKQASVRAPRPSNVRREPRPEENPQ